jgi:hypothetical protein
VKKSVPATFSQKIVDDDSVDSFESEFEFKPVLNPPPEFFELRPVTKNLFQKFAKEPGVERFKIFTNFDFMYLCMHICISGNLEPILRLLNLQQQRWPAL